MIRRMSFPKCSRSRVRRGPSFRCSATDTVAPRRGPTRAGRRTGPRVLPAYARITSPIRTPRGRKQRIYGWSLGRQPGRVRCAFVRTLLLHPRGRRHRWGARTGAEQNTPEHCCREPSICLIAMGRVHATRQAVVKRLRTRPLRRIFEVEPLASSRCGQTMRICLYPACELPETARVPSSHWLDASGTKSDIGDRGKQMSILYPAMQTSDEI